MPLKNTLLKIIHQKLELMIRRGIGPAIVEDMIRYMAERTSQARTGPVQVKPDAVIAEAFLLYVVPQLDGLEQESIQKIYGEVGLLFKEAGDIHKEVLDSIRSLYLHIHVDEWDEYVKDWKTLKKTRELEAFLWPEDKSTYPEKTHDAVRRRQ